MKQKFAIGIACVALLQGCNLTGNIGGTTELEPITEAEIAAFQCPTPLPPYYTSPIATSDTVYNQDHMIMENFADGYIQSVALLRSTGYWVVLLNHENTRSVEWAIEAAQRDELIEFVNPNWVPIAKRNLQLRDANACGDVIFDDDNDSFERWDGQLTQADLTRAGAAGFEIVPYDFQWASNDERAREHVGKLWSEMNAAVAVEPLEVN